MPKIYIKNNSKWNEVLRPLVKDSGVWRQVRRIYVKKEGVWRQVFGNTGTVSYTNPGSFSFTVPAGVYSINVSYPTLTGLVTNSISVVPGQVLTGLIGNFGFGSTFNTITVPEFTKQIFTFSGNVDHLDYFTLKLGSTTAQTYTGTGKGAQHTSACAIKGITLTEGYEGYHGDLSSTITVNTVPNSSLVNQTQIYGTYSYGRYQYGLIQQQPSVSNNYYAIWGPYDPGRSEGYYNYSITLKQIVSFTIDY